jgi:hypothetical protein
MASLKRRDDTDHQRRRFFGAAAMTFAAAPLVMSTLAEAETAKTKTAAERPIKPGTNTTFASFWEV